VGIIGATAGLLLWSRFSGLDTSLGTDEAYTAVVYVGGGPDEIFFGEYTPNNHVLFSLLTWATTGIVGHFEAAYRFWSVIPGLGAVVLVAWWTWRRLSPVAAAAIVVLATISPLHFTLPPHARGYGLAFLAGAGMFVTGVRASESGRLTDVVLFAVFGVVGTWTYPLFVIPFVFQAAVLVIRRDLRRRVLATCGVAAAGTLLFFLPLLGEIVEEAPERRSEQLPWYGPISGPFNDLARPMLTALLPERVDMLTSHEFVAAIYVLFAALGVRWLWRRRRHALLAHIAVPVVGTYLTLTVARFYLEPRNTSSLLFHIILLVSLGAAELWHVMGRFGFMRPLILAATGAVLLVAADDVVTRTRVRSDVPYHNYKFVGQIVDESGVEFVKTNSTRQEGLEYYIGRARLSRARLKVEEDTASLVRSFCYAPGAFVFVDHPGFGAQTPNLACLRLRGAARVRVHQRAPGSMSVWILPGGSGADRMTAAEAYAVRAFCQARDTVETELNAQEPNMKVLRNALARLEAFAPAIPEEARPWARDLREAVFTGTTPRSTGFGNASQAVALFCQSQARP
jgi:hypothetical protein